jgi:hypothetical protein
MSVTCIVLKRIERGGEGRLHPMTFPALKLSPVRLGMIYVRQKQARKSGDLRVPVTFRLEAILWFRAF